VFKGLRPLAAALGERARENEPLAPYTSMRVGGPADLLTVCKTTAEVVDAVQASRRYQVPWLVLGGGCNVLIADGGVRGMVVVNRASQVSISADGTVSAEAGAAIAALAQETAREGMAGLEWAAGLPGTVGGAVVGNAGAFGGDVASVLTNATILENDGVVVEHPATWLELTYRGSKIKRSAKTERAVVLAAKLSLTPGDPEVLADRVAEILKWRKTRHPSGATMGSTFKNPPDGHAGKVIEQAGLKGYQVGGIRISEQHGNFLINTGNATAADVMDAICHVQDQVKEKLGVELELEVEMLGDWPACQ
jgi:UDP-N-acetylmuramate dehydrogenase